MSKLLPWIIAVTMFGGSIFAYAQTSTSHSEQIKVLNSRVEKGEKERKELRELVIKIDKNLEKVLILLEKNK